MLTGKKLQWLIPCLLYIAVAGPARRVEGPDLVPTPDSIEYAMLAGCLADFDPPLIQIDQGQYPSRYPLVFPLALVPFAWIFNFDETKYHWAAFLYGLLTVILMARTAGWILADRRAGSVAAMFWAVHPQTVYGATHLMAETALTTGFFVMLELARPWITLHSHRRTFLRAMALGIVTGLLTVAKAPYGIWAVMMAFMFLASRRQGCRGTLAGMAVGFSAILSVEWIYRAWAFGDGRVNGYTWWEPRYYSEFLHIFNIGYLLEPWNLSSISGNALYYGKMLLGQSDEFYSRYMGICFMISLAGWFLFRTRRNGRFGVTSILFIWGLTGVLFCGLYFFQSSRFPHLWIPLIDMLVAWGLFWGPRRQFLSRGLFGRFKVPQVSRWACMAVIIMLLYGEIRRSVEQYHGPHKDRRMEIQAPHVRSLLERVSPGDWVFSNYEIVLVSRWCPSPGRTGLLYTTGVDSWMNSHAHAIATLDIQPRNTSDKLSTMFDIEGNWNLSPGEESECFGGTGSAWLLIFDPDWFPYTGTYLEKTVYPELNRRLKLEPIQAAGNMQLYRMTPRQ
jgi:hypothetical protein